MSEFTESERSDFYFSRYNTPPPPSPRLLRTPFNIRFNFLLGAIIKQGTVFIEISPNICRRISTKIHPILRKGGGGEQGGWGGFKTELLKK